VGLRHLEIAIAEYKSRCADVEFEVVFTPLMLEPVLYKPVYEKVEHNFRWPTTQGSSRKPHMLLRLALEANPSYIRSIGLTRQQTHAGSSLKLKKDWLARAQRTSAADLARQASLSQPPIGQRATSHDAQASSQQAPATANKVFRELISSTSVSVPSPAMFPRSRGPSLQLSLAIALCRGYFEGRLDLASEHDLVDVAVRVLGFSEVEIRTCLNGEEWARLVEVLSFEASERLRHIGLDAKAPVPLPTLIFQDKFVHQGWPKVETLLKIFDDLREGRKPRLLKP